MGTRQIAWGWPQDFLLGCELEFSVLSVVRSVCPSPSPCRCSPSPPFVFKDIKHGRRMGAGWGGGTPRLPERCKAGDAGKDGAQAEEGGEHDEVPNGEETQAVGALGSHRLHQQK